MLGKQSAVAIWLPMATKLYAPHRIALESPMIGGWWNDPSRMSSTIPAHV